MSKARDLDELTAAVRAAASGESVISPELLARLLPRMRRDGASVRTQLTQREEEVLQLEKKYFTKFTPLYEQRSAIINGKTEPTEAQVEAGEESEDEDDDDASCFMIDIDYSYGNPAVDTREYRDHLETVRYGEEEDWLDSLFGDEKVAAQAAVQLRRSQWDPTKPMTGANAMNVVPPQFRHTNCHPKTVRKRLKIRLWGGKKTA